jgi:hypothetical protein
MYLIAACCLTLRPILAKIPFDGLKSKLRYGQNTGMSDSHKDTVPSGTYPSQPGRSGFIQMGDLYDKRSERGEPPMNVMTRTTITVDIEAAAMPYGDENKRLHE